MVRIIFYIQLSNNSRSKDKHVNCAVVSWVEDRWRSTGGNSNADRRSQGVKILFSLYNNCKHFLFSPTATLFQAKPHGWRNNLQSFPCAERRLYNFISECNRNITNPFNFMIGVITMGEELKWKRCAAASTSSQGRTAIPNYKFSPLWEESVGVWNPKLLVGHKSASVGLQPPITRSVSGISTADLEGAWLTRHAVWILPYAACTRNQQRRRFDNKQIIPQRIVCGFRDSWAPITIIVYLNLRVEIAGCAFVTCIYIHLKWIWMTLKSCGK